MNLGNLNENSESWPLDHDGLEAGSKVPLALLALFEKLISQGGKNCKNRHKVYHYRHSRMHGRALREALDLSQKLGRNTRLERSVGILNEECSKEVI